MTGSPPPKSPPPFEAYRPSEERAAARGMAGGMDMLRAERIRDARPRGPADPPPSRRSLAKTVFMAALLGLGSLAAAAATFLVAAPPAALLRREIVAAVKAGTGRDLAIGGAPSITLFPLGAAMGQASLASPPGMDGGPLIAIERVEAGVAFWPLLRGEIEVERLVLHKPVLELRTDKQGHKNWTFGAAAPRAIQFAEARTPGARRDVEIAAAAEAEPPPRASPPRWLKVGAIRVEDGVIRWIDERKGLTREISAIAADIEAPGLDGPALAKGRAAWSGEPFEFDGRIERLSGALGGEPPNVSLAIKGEPVEANYRGVFALAAADPSLRGEISAKGASVRRLAAWLGTDSPFGSGQGPFAFAGEIETSPSGWKLENAKFDMDGVAAAGSLAVDTGGKRPFWRGKLTLAELDFGAAEQPAEAAAPENGTRVKGFFRRAGWSEEHIDWSFLGRADAAFDLDIGHFRRGAVEAGPGRVKLALEDNKLEAAFEDMKLYKGTAHGVLKVDASREPAAVIADVSGDGMDMGRFLKDAADIEWLLGGGKFSATLGGQGKSERGIVETLNGAARIDIGQGAIAGWNVEKILKRAGEGRFPSLDRTPSEKTDFKKMSASFTIKDGVAENKDLEVTGALARVSGAGKIPLAKREIDYTLRPRLGAAQGAEDGAPGLEIPVRVTGSWEKPKFKADLDGVLKDPGKAVSAIKEIGKQLKGKKIGDIVRGLLGGKGGPKDGADAPPPPPAN